MATNPSLFNSVARKPSLPPASILLPNWISGDDHRSDLLGVAFSIRPSTRPSAVFGRSFYLPIARFLGRRLGSMEKELLETFEAAKKAADLVAEAAECSPEVDRCIDGLRRLKKIPVTKQYLVETQVGKRLRYLTKHKHSKIQVEASSLLELWKNIVIQEMKNGSCENKSSVKNIKSGRTDTVKFDKTSKNEHANMNGISTSDSIKNENTKSERNKMEKNISNDSEKMSKGSYEASIPKKPSSAGSAGPPKLPAMLKCNDPVRDKIRELLAEAFSKVSQETGTDERDEVRNILDEVEARDPIRAAVMVESVMFEKLGRSNGSQKLKYRSVMFNLRDSSNTDLRRRVLLGEVKPERLIVMAPEEMASDKRRQSNEQIKEKALFECERGGAPKATTDEFKCGRCGERKTTYYQMQTRSADEPMTTFVTCVNCNNHWKFC